MNKIIIIISLLSLTFTQELKVEGNLNVTGHIQNQTIDSLLQVIQSLQNQLNSLQGGVSQRVIDITIENDALTNISELFPQYNLDWAILKIVQCPLPESECFFEYPNHSYTVHKLAESGGLFYYNYGFSSSFWTNSEQDFVVSFNQVGTYTMRVLVTAEFPSEPQTQQPQTTSKQSK